MRGRRLVAVIGVVVVMGAGCGGDDGEATETADTAPSATSSSAAPEAENEAENEAEDEGPAAVALAESALGEILVDGQGRTLYLFTRDSGGTSSCTGGCAETWPPAEAPDELVAGDGVDEGMLGTITREDGTEQLTFAGAPLYLFAGDEEVGDTNGQGVGGVWFVVGADGEAIEAAPAGAATEPGY